MKRETKASTASGHLLTLLPSEEVMEVMEIKKKSDKSEGKKIKRLEARRNMGERKVGNKVRGGG